MNIMLPLNISETSMAQECLQYDIRRGKKFTFKVISAIEKCIEKTLKEKNP